MREEDKALFVILLLLFTCNTPPFHVLLLQRGAPLVKNKSKAVMDAVHTNVRLKAGDVWWMQATYVPTPVLGKLSWLVNMLE